MPGRKSMKTVTFHADANGCLSRPAFEGALIAALKREPMATLMDVDLDGLLDLNEQAGHEVGDKAIGAVTAALAAVAKKEAVLQREALDDRLRKHERS